jgi:hypothetical protein
VVVHPAPPVEIVIARVGRGLPLVAPLLMLSIEEAHVAA